jgi:hypothetical protein
VTKTTIILTGLLLLAACGSDEEVQAPSEPAAKVNNPLADQQQAIRDAAKVQGILDQDAERKKKALEEQN